MKKIIKKTFKSVVIFLLLFLVCMVNGPTLVFATSVSDSYTDTTKINTGASSGYSVAGGQLKLADSTKNAWWKMDEASGTSIADSAGSNTGTATLTTALPVGWWKMDEASGTNVADSGTGGNAGTATGTTIVSGNYGNARGFPDAITDYVNIPSVLGLGTTNVTIEAWVNLDSTSESGAFVKVGGTNGYGIGVGASSFDDAGNNLILLYESVRWIDTNTNIGTGWHHVAMVINASGVPSAYIDGNLVNSYTGTNAQTPTGATRIGGYANGNNRYVDADIDDVRIHSAVLTQPQIASDMNNYLYSPTITSGEYGNARSFDGIGGYVLVNDNNSLDIGSKLTIAGWFNVTDTATTRSIIYKGNEYIIRFETTDVFNFFLYDGTDYEPRLSAAVNPSAGVWHHFAAVYDSTLGSNQQKLYIDGVLSSQQDRVITPTATTNNVYIGSAGAGSYFSGSLDDIRVYNTARTLGEIVSDKNNSAFASSGTIISTNLLAGQTGVDGIDEFTYNLSSLPGGTTATVQFNQTLATAATGGTITTSGEYITHTFTSDGTFTVNQAMDVEVLVVGGGGGGGKAEANPGGDGAGGGGAGGLIYNASYPVTAQAYSVVVGGGGSGTTSGTYPNIPRGTNGSNSSLGAGLVAIGGGGGGSDNDAPTTFNKGADGGSGGGAANTYNQSTAASSGTLGQGNAGGDATTSTTSWRGGSGGGGASAAGTARTSTTGGAGGAGLPYSISGTSVTYAGGGGGGGCATTGGSGGAGGGGGGGASAGTGTAGTANTGGGGGGGGSNNGSGGNGGSGIVIVRYRLPPNENTWYNSSGVEGGADTLTTGTNTINIHNLTWSGSNFYYKITFTGDGSTTPVLDDVSLNYTTSGYANTGTTVTDGYSTYTSVNTTGSTNLSLTAGVAKISPSAIYDIGTGDDGAITISSGSKNINSDTLATGRTIADGISYAVTALGTNTITASSAPSGLTAGDEILLINMQGDATNNVNAGTYEFLRVLGISGSVITARTNIQNTYGVGGNADLTGQKIMIQRIPNYTNVTLAGGTTLTASAWDGTKGGLVAFRATGTVTNGGTITANALGYRGGAGGAVSTSGPGAENGESYDGKQGAGGFTTTEPSKGGGRSGNEATASPNNGAVRGGGGGGGKDGSASDANDGGGGGGGGAYFGGGGGAGGAGDYQNVGKEGAAGDATGGTTGGGGGAAGNAPGLGGAPGVAGGNGSGIAGSGGQAGSGATCGSGGGGNANSQGTGAGGGGGGIYGDANLAKIYPGSGGGGGGSSSTYGGTSGIVGRTGGNGGGIIMIYANTLTNNSTISANGANGVNRTEREGASGGGAGGSILLKYGSITAGTRTVTGGTKGTQNGNWGGGGGGGGVGRIYQAAGTTTGISYNTSATLVSANLLSGVSSVKSIDSFDYTISIPEGTTATVQFSQDGANWYNSSGSANGTNDLTDGTHNIGLSALGWGGPYFYYKVAFTGAGTSTPTLDTVTVNYTTATGSTTSVTWAVCTPLQGNNWTIGSNCFFPKTGNSLPYKNIDGVDGGDLTVSAYKTLTVKGDQIIVRNNGKQINVQGSIAINDIPVGGVGGNVRDYSGNNNEGDAVGSTIVAGKYGTARYFGSNSNYVTCSDTDCGGTTSPKLDFDASTSFTYGEWFNSSTTQTSRGIFGKKTTAAASDAGYTTVISAAGTQIICRISDGTNQVSVNMGSTVLDGNWHHIACVVDRGAQTLTAYLDGSPSSPTSISAVGSLDNSSDVRAGIFGGGTSGFIGSIDDIRIYRYARSASQVTEDVDYTPNSTGDPAIVWWRFEDGGQIKETNLWGQDVDGDGWTQTLETQDKAQTDTPGTGWVRRKDTAGSIFGTGKDGTLTFATNTNLSTANSGTRSCDDGGDAVSYNITAFGSTTLANGLSGTTATLSAAPSPGCLTAGDNVLIINAQGTSSAYGNTGNYELLKIYSISDTTITFTTEKKKNYGDGANDTNLGTATTNQRVVMQRLPQYENVTINTGVTVNANAWNGTKGGIVAFQVKGTLTNGGTISASELGFRGSNPGTAGGWNGGLGGETYNGYPGSGYGGGGAGGGGGGGTRASGTANSTATVGGGGGGGGARWGQGGGAGFVTVGNGGTGASGYNGAAGSGTSGGAGGGGANNVGGGGGGGGTYGDANLAQIFMGSAGGADGNSAGGDGCWDPGGIAGRGGGIVLIMANTLTNSGSIFSKGQTSTSTPCTTNASGTGGSVKVFASTATLGTVSAIAGTAGPTSSVGRVAVGATTKSGTTTPTYVEITAP